MALARQLAHDVGHERDPPLALRGLLGDSDPHGGGNLSDPRRVRRDRQTPAAGGRQFARARPRARPPRPRLAPTGIATTRAKRISSGLGIAHDLVERRPARPFSSRSSGSATPARRRSRDRLGRAPASRRGGRRRGAGRRGCRRRDRLRLRARRTGERERLARERGQRLRGDPHRRLGARARVADGAVGADERAQVGRAASARRRAARAPGSRPAAIRPWTAHAVDCALLAPPCSAKPPSAFWWRTSQAAARRTTARAPRARRRERLQRRAGVVGARRPAAAGEVEAAVAVGLPRDERGRRAAPRGRSPGGPAARSASTANAVVFTRPANEPSPSWRAHQLASRSRPPSRAGGTPAARRARIVRDRSPRSPRSSRAFARM